MTGLPSSQRRMTCLSPFDRLRTWLCLGCVPVEAGGWGTVGGSGVGFGVGVGNGVGDGVGNGVGDGIGVGDGEGDGEGEGDGTGVGGGAINVTVTSLVVFNAPSLASR